MVITETLKLLKDITGGYESSKMLLDLDSVNYVLQHHTVNEYLENHPIGRRIPIPTESWLCSSSFRLL